ncbi:hypothetical protein TIFTF001_047091 [Ficus carica]|uniref:Uncharacterized protein n=1 Tax=Ficus carica TaxID=3494 RepID=A0AA87YS02_FICCA|nr:hypothetical protein TIFTF001_047091 [Ficus carica]
MSSSNVRSSDFHVTELIAKAEKLITSDDPMLSCPFTEDFAKRQVMGNCIRRSKETWEVVLFEDGLNDMIVKVILNTTVKLSGKASAVKCLKMLLLEDISAEEKSLMRRGQVEKEACRKWRKKRARMKQLIEDAEDSKGIPRTILPIQMH